MKPEYIKITNVDDENRGSIYYVEISDLIKKYEDILLNVRTEYQQKYVSDFLIALNKVRDRPRTFVLTRPQQVKLDYIIQREYNYFLELFQEISPTKLDYH